MPHQRLLVLFAVLSTGAQAQWLSYPTPGIPRTRDGKPNLAASAPRAANGNPDLSGAWYVQPTSLAEWKVVLGDRFDTQFKGRSVGMELDHISELRVRTIGMDLREISPYGLNIFKDFKPEEAPMRPEAAEILRRRAPGDLPQTSCLPVGIPADGLFSPPIKIVQSPGVIVILYENDGRYRQIYTDGRQLLKEVVQPAWLGYSAGKWERDTLVVETTGFNDKTWLDLMGHPHSEALRVAERYRRRDFGHMDAEMTFDDPQMYTKPFTIKVWVANS